MLYILLLSLHFLAVSSFTVSLSLVLVCYNMHTFNVHFCTFCTWKFSYEKQSCSQTWYGMGPELHSIKYSYHMDLLPPLSLLQHVAWKDREPEAEDNLSTLFT